MRWPRSRLAFADQGKAVFLDYPGVGHGFNCWGRPSYAQKAAALAHGLTLRFLSQHLGAPYPDYPMRTTGLGRDGQDMSPRRPGKQLAAALLAAS